MIKNVFIGIILFFVSTSCLGQKIEINGLWFNEKNSYLEIIEDKNQCSLSNGFYDFNYLDTQFTLNCDTLSVYDLSNHRLLFKVKQPSTIQIELLPINIEAKLFLQKDTILTLTKTGFLVDNSIDFEEITYNYNLVNCDVGDCQERHIRINSKGEVSLFLETVNFSKGAKPYKSGFFYGQLNAFDLNNLKQLLKLCNLRNLEFDNNDCCDSPVTVLVIYFNQQRKYLKSDNPPRITTDLINYMNFIVENTLFLNSPREFNFEGQLRLRSIKPRY